MSGFLKFALSIAIILGIGVLMGGIYVGNFNIASWPQDVRQTVVIVPLVIAGVIFMAMFAE